MPIPFILGGIAVAAGLLGAAAHVSASETRKKAKELYDDSNRRQHNRGRSLEEATLVTTSTSEDLGLLKLNIQKNEIARFLNLYKKLQSLNLKRIAQENLEFNFTIEQIKTMEKISMSATEILGAGVNSLAAGALAGAGVYSSVMAFGAASTGTAISTLSGVAATNATLAWLGGGALAAGGGGMALGSTILGGLVAGPAIFVSGIFADIKADEALSEAKEFEAEVDIVCEKMQTRISVLQAIQVRCGEFTAVLTELRNRLIPQLTQLETVVNQFSINIEPSDSQLKTIHLTYLLAKTLKDVLDINILDEKGNITHESRNVKQKLIAIGA